MPSTQPNAMTIPEPNPAPDTRPFSISAKRIFFYSDIYSLGADGNVRLRLADGTILTGNTFSMDLKLNRFVIAGDVHLQPRTGEELHGAAYSAFLDYSRAYFVPILDSAQNVEPDRWTFLANDYAHPLRGRDMPGDTFFLPDLTRQHIFLYGSSARVVPRESVSFSPAYINLDFVSNGNEAYLPTPNYYFNFSSNPNFAQNGLAGASFDAPYPFWGDHHSVSAFHLRYDSINRVYLAFEQHLAVTDHSYLVLSANPITRPQKSYNLLGMEHISPKVQAQLFVQENAFQSGFSQPLSAVAFAQLQVTAGLRHSFLQWNSDQFWESLLADPGPIGFYGTPQHNWVPNHPTDWQISWTSFDNRVWHQPLYVQWRSGLGSVHDSQTPPQTVGTTAYPTVHRQFLGGRFYTPALTLRKPPFRNMSFNAFLDKQRTWYSSRHYVDATITSLSLSKSFDRHVSAFVNYSITNVNDVYGSLQGLIYAPVIPVSPITGQAYPGYTAFTGAATTRSLTESVIWTPTQYVTANFSLRQNHDFPEPIPYLDAPLLFGQTLGFNQHPDIGVSPQQFNAELRMRLRPNLLLDVSQSYYFHWGNRNWNPQFTFLISQ